MAEQAASTAIREAVAVRLRTISLANGFRTNVGDDVRTEPSQFRPGDGSRITVWPATRIRPDDARSAGERAFSMVIEIQVPVEMETPLAELEAAEEDVEQALNAYLQQPNALPAHFAESVILDRPEGVPAMASQMIFVTRYRR